MRCRGVHQVYYYHKVGEKYRGAHQSNGIWTRELKENLCTLADKFGFSAYASGPRESKAGREWLYDLCWLEMSEPNGRNSKILDVPLVFESEWARGGINDDFQKILIARARLRVMVFETRTDKETREIVDGLIEQINACKQSVAGDIYLLAAWQAGEKFEFRMHRHKS